MGASDLAKIRRGFGAKLLVLCAIGVGSAVTVSGVTGCIATTHAQPPRGVIVTGPPPAPIAEAQPPPPGPQALWVPGYWHWSGVQYAWVPGRWEERAPGAQWYAPHYTQSQGSYFYEPGGWHR
jgi:hypothetical protein